MRIDALPDDQRPRFSALESAPTMVLQLLLLLPAGCVHTVSTRSARVRKDEPSAMKAVLEERTIRRIGA